MPALPSRHWLLTLNLPSEDDSDSIYSDLHDWAVSHTERHIVAQEHGKHGKRHYHAAFIMSLPKRVDKLRDSLSAKLGVKLDRVCARLTQTRGTDPDGTLLVSAVAYCTKDGTFETTFSDEEIQLAVDAQHSKETEAKRFMSKVQFYAAFRKAAANHLSLGLGRKTIPMKHILMIVLIQSDVELLWIKPDIMLKIMYVQEAYKVSALSGGKAWLAYGDLIANYFRTKERPDESYW